jgi:formylglycine-generating enzyme required for sulfatase activity
MTATSASAGRTATFLLRQQRQTRGFRLPLADLEPHQVPADGAGIAAAAGAGQPGEPEAGVPRGASGEERPAAAPGPVLTLLEIPPGCFTMGSPHTERQRSADEGPQRLVTLAGFMISQTPITQAQWRAVATWRERPGERWQRPLQPNPSRFQWR